MTPANIATVFGPNLMYERDVDPIQSLQDSQYVNELIRFLVIKHDSLKWEVDTHTAMVRNSVIIPKDLINQLHPEQV